MSEGDLERLISDGYSLPGPGDRFARDLGARLGRELKSASQAPEKPFASRARTRWALATAAVCIVIVDQGLCNHHGAGYINASGGAEISIVVHNPHPMYL